LWNPSGEVGAWVGELRSVEGCASGGRLLGTDAAPASEAGAPLHDHWAIAITALRTCRTHQIEARLAVGRNPGFVFTTGISTL
jgi:hypothetical protein